MNHCKEFQCVKFSTSNSYGIFSKLILKLLNTATRFKSRRKNTIMVLPKVMGMKKSARFCRFFDK